MPKENDFLKRVQANQFVQDNNDQIKRNLSGVMSNSTKAFTASTKIQIQNLSVLRVIENSISSLNKHIMNQSTLMSKELLNSQKSTKLFLQESAKNISRSKQVKTRDLFEKKDPDNDMRKNIADIENLMIKILKLQQNEDRNKKSGLASFASGLLGLGGLAGFMLTGKSEMLFSVAKGMKGLLSPVTKLLSKGIGGIFKPLTGLVGKGLSTMFKPLTKGLGKGLGKVFGKGASKSFLKKIPGVGSIMGLLFGISRFKKGQYIEGVLEIASGIASVVPGAGTALSLAIDSFLLFKDFKGIDVGPESTNQKAFAGAKKLGKTLLHNLPGIGTVLGIKDGFDLWKSGNKTGALKTFGRAMSTIIPMGGFIFDGVSGLIDSVKENGVVATAMNIFGKGKEMVASASSVVGSTYAKGKDLYNTAKGKIKSGKKILGHIKNLQTPEDVYGDLTKKESVYGGTSSKFDFGTGKSYLGSYPSITLNDDNIDMGGLQPQMFSNFLGMTNEYYQKTGKNVQVNSAKRRGVGNSSHDYGWAIDIQSNDANKLESSGLMEKYGFHRPLINWGRMPGGKNEPWHVEPYPGKRIYGQRNTINNSFRKGSLMGKSVEQGGGGFNVPQGTVEGVVDGNRPIQVMLSSRDINTLAEAFGEQIRKNKQNIRSVSTAPQSVNSRAF